MGASVSAGRSSVLADAFAPNGWGCKCTIRQVSRGEYAQLAAQGTIHTEAPEIRTVRWVNKRTGEEEDVPEGMIRAGTTIPV